MKKILVILGHPDCNSLCGAISRAYVEGARDSGADIRVLNLGDLNFDPVLWNGYNSIQALEPDLVRAQELVLWSELLVLVYPNWWGSMPALMKGFFDRVFLPGFAFSYREGVSLPEKRLKGRKAHLLVTMDTPSWYNRWIIRRPGYFQMKRTILEFCGIKVSKITEFAPVKGSSGEKRDRWVVRARKLGRDS